MRTGCQGKFSSEASPLHAETFLDAENFYAYHREMLTATKKAMQPNEIVDDLDEASSLNAINLAALPSDKLTMVNDHRAGPITFDDLRELESHIHKILNAVRVTGNRPGGVKTAPRINATQLAKLCRKSNTTMSRLLERAAEFGLANGYADDHKGGNGKRRMFSTADAIGWIRKVGTMHRRAAADTPGCVISVGNFKGGVGKTVFSACLSQALSLMGYKVLCIDLDPQGSLTSLFDIDRFDVDEMLTFLPLTLRPSDPNHRPTLQESIQETYWPGIDIVAGTPALFSGEFWLPMRQMDARLKEPDFRFMEVLDRALDDGIRDEYDYIIIDTPPALSYITMNAYWAADGILVPLPAEGIDLVSSAQFWSMFTELGASAEASATKPKSFSWISVVPSKIDHSKTRTKVNLKVMQAAYQSYLMPLEIPESAAIGNGGVTLKTVYDMESYAGSAKTYARSREALDRLAEEIDYMTRLHKWGQSPEQIESVMNGATTGV